MHVRWLELSAFRNHPSLSFAPDPGLNVLIGPNGQGKTTILEAVHLLLTGRSFRTLRLAECVAWGGAEGGVAGEIVRRDRRSGVRLRVVPRPGGAELVGALCPWARAVSFTGSDLGLLTGPPAGRRAYLDGATAKLVPAHAEACRRYRIVLHQRGQLLARLGERGDADRLLGPWDEQVAALGGEIVHRRLDTLAALREGMQGVWGAIAPDCPGMELVYEPAVAPDTDVASTRARLLEALATGRRQELSRGVTLVGPHRDDLVVRLDGVDARIYASRGEQRLLVLALRLSESEPVRRRSGATPVLLLDDLLSELDLGARARVLAWLATQEQVLFSSADAVELPAAAGATWAVRDGAVERVDAPVARGVA